MGELFFLHQSEVELPVFIISEDWLPNVTVIWQGPIYWKILFLHLIPFFRPTAGPTRKNQ